MLNQVFQALALAIPLIMVETRKRHCGALVNGSYVDKEGVDNMRVVAEAGREVGSAHGDATPRLKQKRQKLSHSKKWLAFVTDLKYGSCKRLLFFVSIPLAATNK